jgi:fructose-1,6-bisphosphatase/inositol monophosphatase family enzyme
MKKDLVEEVTVILREVVAEVILPAFSHGVPVPGWEKSRGEIVTAVDRSAEQRITERLRDLQPSSIVLGEEACAAEPDLLNRLGDEDVWLLDPLDGTRNFAAGREPFAVMLARLQRGQAVAAWILDPLAGRTVVAEQGSGAWSGEQRLFCRRQFREPSEATAIVSDAFVPAERADWLSRLKLQLGEARPTRRCAGAEYPLLAGGALDLILYWRTLPWDHAAGTLLVTEAGGLVRQLDGSAYDPARSKPGLLCCATEELMEAVLAFGSAAPGPV